MINVSRGSCTFSIVSGESFKCIDLEQIRQNEKGKVRLKLVRSHSRRRARTTTESHRSTA